MLCITRVESGRDMLFGQFAKFVEGLSPSQSIHSVHAFGELHLRATHNLCGSKQA